MNMIIHFIHGSFAVSGPRPWNMLTAGVAAFDWRLLILCASVEGTLCLTEAMELDSSLLLGDACIHLLTYLHVPTPFEQETSPADGSGALQGAGGPAASAGTRQSVLDGCDNRVCAAHFTTSAGRRRVSLTCALDSGRNCACADGLDFNRFGSWQLPVAGIRRSAKMTRNRPVQRLAA